MVQTSYLDHLSLKIDSNCSTIHNLWYVPNLINYSTLNVYFRIKLDK